MTPSSWARRSLHLRADPPGHRMVVALRRHLRRHSSSSCSSAVRPSGSGMAGNSAGAPRAAASPAARQLRGLVEPGVPRRGGVSRSRRPGVVPGGRASSSARRGQVVLPVVAPQVSAPPPRSGRGGWPPARPGAPGPRPARSGRRASRAWAGPTSLARCARSRHQQVVVGREVVLELHEHPAADARARPRRAPRTSAGRGARPPRRPPGCAARPRRADSR